MQNNLWRVVIESPGDEVFIGRGICIEDAYKEAIKNFRDASTPTKGPGIWEIDPNQKP
jgi:hypothetical protein